MDQTKRLILFVVLSTAFIFAWEALFPRTPPAPVRPPADSAAASSPAQAPGLPVAALPSTAPSQPGQPERFVHVRSPLYDYRFSTRGAALNAATLPRFSSYVQAGQSVQLVPRSARDVLARRLVVGRDTLDFRGVHFTPDAASLVLRESDGPRQLRFVSDPVGAVRAELTYTFRPNDYTVDVQGRFIGLPAGVQPQMVTELGTGLAPHDAVEHGSANELAVVGWNRERVERESIRKIQAPDTLAGPLVWTGIKDRYFLIAL
ncbi:membrane protein insertase YidC, partial [Longimicrobium sp.]|uniref:membrane protein insertase YidC n=1 Tax=Longimicrobium sp. TaxID=2029185 RepID=UPI002F95D808